MDANTTIADGVLVNPYLSCMTLIGLTAELLAKYFGHKRENQPVARKLADDL